MFMPPEFRLPVNGMKRPKKDSPFVGTELEHKVRYYENDGTLDGTYKKNRFKTRPFYFLQSRDGEMHTVTKSNHDNEALPETLLPLMNGCKKRDCIRFDWPIDKPNLYDEKDGGVWYLLAMHHPHQLVRMFVLNNYYDLAHLVPFIKCQPEREPIPLTA